MDPGLVTVGPDGARRCWWGSEPAEYRRYHDREWGFGVTSDERLFEKICLEGFQAGLSWLTVLRKRENFRDAFSGFDPERVVEFGERDVERLMGDAGIIRHQGKIRSVINNAARALEVVASHGSLSAFFATAHEAAPGFVGDVVELLGGREAMLQQMRAADPWIVVLELDDSPEGATATGRFLHISDTEQGDPDDTAHAIARCLWNLVPGIDGVDVRAVLPGGGPRRIGGHERGISQLVREAALSEHATAWNRTRVQVIRTLLGVNDSQRLQELLPLLGEATRLAHQIGSQLVKDLPDTPNLSDLRPSVEALHSAATHIKPPMRRAGLEEPGILDRPNPLENDDAVALITDLTRNIVPRLTQPDQYRRLVVYIRESVVATHLEGCKEEPWPFVGVDSYPGCLDELRETLLDIAAVLEVLERSESEPAAIRGSALAGNQDETLRRAAEWCRRQHTKEGSRRRSEIQTACQATGLDVNVLPNWHEDGPLREFAITVELPSLL